MKKLMMAVCLLLCAAMLSSCAYLPLMTGRTAALSTNTQGVSGNSDVVTISREEYDRYRKMDEALEVLDAVQTYYYQDVDEEKLLEGAAAGILAATGDHYTFYYSPEDYASYWEDDNGEYAGIGIQITSSYVTGLSTVSRVFDGSPAQAVGVHRGDILYKVNDEMIVTAYNIDDAVKIMRGVPGTTVDVTFLRGEEELTFTIERAKINQNRVSSMMMDGQIGYIRLYEFAGESAAEFEQQARALADQGARGIIVDLRDNPGGWVDHAEKIGDLFLDEGLFYYLEYRSGMQEKHYTRDGRIDLPLVVLVNENSASASELLTGALQDRGAATVVGTQSYGKGIVQSMTAVGSRGAGMQITIAQYFTPNGNAVHKIGITPDVRSELPEGDNGMYDFGSLEDPQLNKAYEIMELKLQGVTDFTVEEPEAEEELPAA